MEIHGNINANHPIRNLLEEADQTGRWGYLCLNYQGHDKAEFHL